MIKRYLLHIEIKIGKTNYEDTEKFFFKFNAKRMKRFFTKYWESQGYEVISYIIRLL